VVVCRPSGHPVRKDVKLKLNFNFFRVITLVYIHWLVLQYPFTHLSLYLGLFGICSARHYFL
jgi:hypothetical protein